MTPAAFDFRCPPPGTLELQLETWLGAACRQAAVAWAKLLPFPAELQLGSVEAVVGSSVPESRKGYSITTGDASDGAAFLLLPKPLLLILLAGVLGETPASLPDDREPTELETSLIGYLLRELFLEPLEQTWIGSDRLVLTVSSARIASSGSPIDMILHARLTAKTPLGEQSVQLFLPRTGTWEKLGRVQIIERATPTDPEHITALVREMPVDLAVVLGTANVSMSEIARLQHGDVIIFRQKVDEPLDGLVAGEKKFQVWPGALGDRMAVQIKALAID